jgi:hypothetical protein
MAGMAQIIPFPQAPDPEPSALYVHTPGAPLVRDGECLATVTWVETSEGDTEVVCHFASHMDQAQLRSDLMRLARSLGSGDVGREEL